MDFLIYGTFMPITFRAARGPLQINLRSSEALKALGAGVVSFLAYGAMMSALAFGPLGPVSALRETSVVFAVLIGRFFLGETMSVQRVVACALVAVGVFFLSYQA